MRLQFCSFNQYKVLNSSKKCVTATSHVLKTSWVSNWLLPAVTSNGYVITQRSSSNIYIWLSGCFRGVGSTNHKLIFTRTWPTYTLASMVFLLSGFRWRFSCPLITSWQFVWVILCSNYNGLAHFGVPCIVKIISFLNHEIHGEQELHQNYILLP